MSDENKTQGKKPIVPILIVVLVVAAGVIAFLLLNKPKVDVPDLVFLEREEAAAELSKVGLKLGKVTEEKNDEIPLGDIVFKTSPEKGTSVAEGTTVDLTVSTGPKLSDEIDVPDLTGLSPEEAEQKAAEALFIPQPGKQMYSDTVEAGKVCAQSIQAGSKAKVLSIITYSTSLGKEQVTVPDVTGKPIAEARDALNKAGLGVDTAQSYSDTVAKDVVISQSVEKDTQVTKGTTVTLTVSLGKKPAAKVVVPNIMSYTRDDAIKALESAGLKYSYTGDEDGTVTRVRPVPNTQVDQGSTVTFELKLPEAVPDNTTSQSQSQNQPQSQTQPENTNNNNNTNTNNNNDNGNADEGDPINYTKDQAQQIAGEFVGAGGQAKGPMIDPTVTGPTQGGGITYYTVEFNLGEAHYSVQVDATTGKAVGGDMTFNGSRWPLDENGDTIEDARVDV